LVSVPSLRNVIDNKTAAVLNENDFSTDVHLSGTKAVPGKDVLVIPAIYDGETMGLLVARGESRAKGLREEQCLGLEPLAVFLAEIVAANRLRAGLRDLQRVNHDLSEVQKATTAILDLIARSAGDTKPVLQRIAELTAQLCDAPMAVVYLIEGQTLYPGAAFGIKENGIKAMHKLFPRPIARDCSVGRAVLSGKVCYIPDVREDPEYALGDQARDAGYRSTVSVPMFAEGKSIGVIATGRSLPDTITDREISLLETFARVAEVSLVNARLYKELQTRSAELRESVEGLQTLAQINNVVTSTLDVEQVLRKILISALAITGADSAMLYDYDEKSDSMIPRSSTGVPKDIADGLRRYPIKRGEGVVGVAVATLQPFQHPDILRGGIYFLERTRKLITKAGFRSVLAVPLAWDNKIMGALVVHKNRPNHTFSAPLINLLRTFATQSALAMQNARYVRTLGDYNVNLKQRVAEQVQMLDRLNRLRRFFSPKLAELIVSGGTSDPLKTHRALITVCFLDLRGFTAFVEQVDENTLMRVLREFQALMGELIVEHDGTLERFTGDGMMVFFNDPVQVPNPEERAVRMALAMRERSRKLIAKWHKRGYQLGLGIGIARGRATLGAIGFEGRWDYGAIGTVTNLASRLCHKAKSGQILISKHVCEETNWFIDVRFVGDLVLAGFSRPIPAYEVLEES
jgi:class 3 adenylate cyclase/putative methionine-R-sulfoxide reductase with GAF domain